MEPEVLGSNPSGLAINTSCLFVKHGGRGCRRTYILIALLFVFGSEKRGRNFLLGVTFLAVIVGLLFLSNTIEAGFTRVVVRFFGLVFLGCMGFCFSVW